MTARLKGALIGASVFLALGGGPCQGDNVWRRGVEKGVHIAAAGLEDGTLLGFFCAPLSERRLAFVTLRPGLMRTPIRYDEKAMNMRITIDEKRYDLMGKAEDGEIYVEIDDYNLALQLEAIMSALSAGSRAAVSIPTKQWSAELPLDGAGAALQGLMAPCR